VKRGVDIPNGINAASIGASTSAGAPKFKAAERSSLATAPASGAAVSGWAVAAASMFRSVVRSDAGASCALSSGAVSSPGMAAATSTDAGVLSAVAVGVATAADVSSLPDCIIKTPPMIGTASPIAAKTRALDLVSGFGLGAIAAFGVALDVPADGPAPFPAGLPSNIASQSAADVKRSLGNVARALSMAFRNAFE